MRIDRLDLTRYGRFTDGQLPFGAVRPGTPDLHIVYGDNEAGKTTTYHALLDLLFGIEAATPYKFLHQAAALRLGGALEIGGETREVIRLPKQRTLVDTDERPLPEGLFSDDLAGLDRASYRTMFSLDEKTLAAGGESILSSQGDLGHLLFSATAGLADFSSALAGLRSETEAFYKFHGRKHGLADLKKQLADLKDRKAAIDVMAIPFARLLTARDAAHAAYEAAAGERTILRAALDEMRRHDSVLPRLAEWRALSAERAALPDLPSAPPGWTRDVADLQKAEIELGTRQAALDDEIERLSADIAILPADPGASAAAPRLRQVSDLRARCLTAIKDLPDRRAALQVEEAGVARLLAALGQDGAAAPHALLLRADVVDRLRQAIESLSGTTAAVREATTELLAARHRQAEAQAALDAIDLSAEPRRKLDGLVVMLGVAQADDSTARLRLATRTCATLGDTLSQCLAALAPWQGDVDALARLAVPDRTARARMAETLAAARAEVERRQTDVERLEGAVRHLRADRQALLGESGLVADAAATASRHARDVAWEVHVIHLDTASARAFEQALRADDAVVVARFGHAKALADMRSVERALATASADLDLATRRRAGAEDALRTAGDAITAHVSAVLGGDDGGGLDALDRFVVRRDRALEACERLRGADLDLAHARADHTRLCDDVARVLHGAGIAHAPEADLSALIHAGRAAMDREAEARILRLTLATSQREVRARECHRLDTEQAHHDWQAAWLQALRETWFADTCDVATVRSALAHLADLGHALDRRRGLADRIAKMDADIRGFATVLADIAAPLGFDTAAVDVLDLAERVTQRVEAAVRTDGTRTSKAADLRKAKERLAQLHPHVAAVARRAAEMTAYFSVTGLTEVALALDAARRRDSLDDRLRALAVEICAACGVRRVEDADVLLSGVDRAERDSQRVALDARCDDQDQRTQDLFAARCRAQDAVDAVDGDEAAARLDEVRRTLLLDIADRTLTHLSMRAGILAAEGAISLYRDRHRSSMMEQASALFQALSRGAYSGLVAQSTKDSEVLVGLPAGGGSKLSTEMSTATRNQLYLALRIAGYREFVKARRPLPFVLDDVLETFDNDRAEAALVLLAEMAQTGQVIYLTHHRHLCDIAQRICPAATHHDLGRLA